MLRFSPLSTERPRPAQRCGASSWPLAIMLGSLVLLGWLIWQLGSGTTAKAPTKTQPAETANVKDEPLIVWCAASNQRVMEAIRADYEAEFGVPVQVQYGASQSILASAEVSNSGDLYLPADDSYLKIALQRGLSESDLPLATMRVVVAVAEGNPKQIAALADLLRDDVRVSLANPDAAAVGKLTRDVLMRRGEWNRLAARAAVFKTTVTEVATDVKLRTVDAGIVFDAVLHDFPGVEPVSLPELADAVSHFGVAVLKSSSQPQRATHFARYLSASDKGLLRYREFGFQPVAGSPWTDTPAAAEASGETGAIGGRHE